MTQQKSVTTNSLGTTHERKKSMKIGERNFEIRSLHKKVVPFARILWGLRRLEEPLRYLSWYLKRGSPDQVQFTFIILRIRGEFSKKIVSLVLSI